MRLCLSTAETRRAIEQSGLAYTHLRHGFYQDVLALFYTLAGDVLRGNASPAAKVNPIARADLVEVAFVRRDSCLGLSGQHILNDVSKYRNTVLDLVGPEQLTMPEIAELTSKADGKPHQYVQAPKQAVIDAMTPRVGSFRAQSSASFVRSCFSSLAPTLAATELGYPVMAFCTLQIQQRKGRQAVVDHLRGIPEVLEVHTITGGGDLLARVVARDNADLQRVIDQIVETGLVVHASTTIALAELVSHRTLPLAEEAAHAKRG